MGKLWQSRWGWEVAGANHKRKKRQSTVAGLECAQAQAGVGSPWVRSLWAAGHQCHLWSLCR